MYPVMYAITCALWPISASGAVTWWAVHYVTGGFR